MGSVDHLSPETGGDIEKGGRSFRSVSPEDPELSLGVTYKLRKKGKETALVRRECSFLFFGWGLVFPLLDVPKVQVESLSGDQVVGSESGRDVDGSHHRSLITD